MYFICFLYEYMYVCVYNIFVYGKNEEDSREKVAMWVVSFWPAFTL